MGRVLLILFLSVLFSCSKKEIVRTSTPLPVREPAVSLSIPRVENNTQAQRRNNENIQNRILPQTIQPPRSATPAPQSQSDATSSNNTSIPAISAETPNSTNSGNGNQPPQNTVNVPIPENNPVIHAYRYPTKVFQAERITYTVNERVTYQTRLKWIKTKTRLTEKRLNLAEGSLIPFLMGQSLVFVEQYIKGNSQITYFFVHPDEITAYIALKKHIDKNGGRAFLFIGEGPEFAKRIRYIVYRINRFPFGLDPNRIYTGANSLRAEFLKLGYMRSFWANNAWYWNRYQSNIRKAIGMVSGFYKILAEVSPDPIIGVHDNPGNLLWAKDIFSGRNSSRIAEKWYQKPGTWFADFIYVIREQDFHFLKNLGVNVILQNNRTVPNDGSMSVYFAGKNRRYMCLEVGRTGFETRVPAAMELLKIIHDYILSPGIIANGRRNTATAAE